MKALIMEDEVQIRERIEKGIPWKRYGISEVYTAKNGEIGFEMAKKFHPEIIFADIRMPRLGGISAAKKLRKITPDCSIIFVSAYPEKQYFKEAIRLKAVSFVEKPINMQELQQVLSEAIKEQKQNRHQQDQNEKAWMYRTQILVQRLCRNSFTDKAERQEELKKLDIDEMEYHFFFSAIVMYMGRDEGEDKNGWELYCMKQEQRLKETSLQVIGAQKQENCIVYHFFLRSEKEKEEAIQWLLEMIEGLARFYVLVGGTKTSASRLSDSYRDAVLMENRAFFAPYGKVIQGQEEEIAMNFDFSSWKAEFTEVLGRKNYEQLKKCMENYRQQILLSKKIHYIAVRKFYLYLYGELERHMEQKNIFLERMYLQENTRAVLLQKGNYQELHQSIMEILEKLDSKERDGESQEIELITRVKKYIQENYSNPWLSIKEVADVAEKSVSHLCVIYKKETGITLNQYITEVRMENARILLENPRNNIKTVAEKTGYADGGYFSRAFKKYTGQTPSEYRGEAE